MTVKGGLSAIAVPGEMTVITETKHPVGSIEMGLIKNIFGSILGIIGSVLGALGGILKLGKKGEFYMELDESATSRAKVAPAKVAESAPATATAIALPPEPSVATVPEKSTKAAKHAKSKKSAKATEQPTPTGASTPVIVAVPVVAAPAEVKTFATDYLVNPQLNRSSRRRPGPSVAPFKEMARNIGKQSPSAS
jgi:hypothetical protein